MRARSQENSYSAHCALNSSKANDPADRTTNRRVKSSLTIAGTRLNSRKNTVAQRDDA